MSWKGFQKGVSRAPQSIKQKFNIGDITKDAVYVDAERRFAELEKETQKLHSESEKYFKAINAMLSHQIEFSKACAEIYKPISGRVSDPDSIISEGNPEGIQACEEYENIVRDLQTTLQPELEMIETRVIRPAVELLEVVKTIRKATVKRDHKQIDYDRHRTALKKLQDKKDRTLKDEKALYKAEADTEQATQEYDYFNNLVKDDLPKLFALERDFIRPLFQSFYYMQLNVFYTLHEKMQSIDIGYFNLQLDIEEAFEMKRGETQAEAEALSIVHFKTTGGRKPVAQRYGRPGMAIEDSKKPLAIEDAKRTSSIHSTDAASSVTAAPPPYSAGANGGTATPLAAAGGWAGAASGKAKPPPPKPKPMALKGASQTETVTALYDYDATAAGDLSFKAGDVIEIVQRTQNENEWWTGRLNGAEGQFPGNYVQLA